MAIAANLKKGVTKSCGCLQKETVREQRLIHGQTGTRLNRIWQIIKRRTTNENTKDYKDYGERGIKVCPEWINDYQAFHDWAMANGYQDGLQIDRIDNDGDYTPDNCRWTTKKEQANNKRTNKRLEFNGETHTMRKWAAITGINYSTLQDRIKRGWSIEKTLTEKTNERMRRQ